MKSSFCLRTDAIILHHHLSHFSGFTSILELYLGIYEESNLAGSIMCLMWLLAGINGILTISSDNRGFVWIWTYKDLAVF